ncbi:MAG: methylated-DNA--[protein]-cysteine S-methyltransferase [Alphaproteobacteria bacterium]|nr:methylated-DNA--[protein]-cysteine S-methyltransferase [Alphaproteobacteria bacterium]
MARAGSAGFEGPPAAGRSTYAAMARAIAHLVTHYQDQPGLADLAAIAGLHPHHFQRVFKRWAGISPKRFAQYLTVEHAKALLRDSETVLGAALDVGLSGPGRLHDLFVACEAMTPGEYKAQGRDLEVRWGVHDSPFGPALIGTTDRGVCLLRFVSSQGGAAGPALAGDGTVEDSLAEWSAATLVHDPAATAATAARLFEGDAAASPEKLLLRGTNFQVQVWQALLRIPPGQAASYRRVAASVCSPRAARAVGQAVAANPIGVLIPCHRVIRETGALGGYRWGTDRKRALLAWESGRQDGTAGDSESGRAAQPASDTMA